MFCPICYRRSVFINPCNEWLLAYFDLWPHGQFHHRLSNCFYPDPACSVWLAIRVHSVCQADM